MELIVAQEVYKSYESRFTPKVDVLKGINLRVGKGEMVAIKGPSGAGKSTLLHILGCMGRPTKGKYYYNGDDITKSNMTILSKHRNQTFGFVLQSFGLIFEETALENVKLPLYFSKCPFREMNDVAIAMMNKLNIAHLANKRIMHLSGGEKQRVAMARALVNDPSVILADEPTGALDSTNAAILMDLLHEQNKAGKTVIIVTHEDYVAQRCSRVIKIKDGVIIG
jgi:putative ABC transport system ATP-binding protein